MTFRPSYSHIFHIKMTGQIEKAGNSEQHTALLFYYPGDQPCSHGSASFPNIKPLPILYSDRVDNIAEHLHIITGHHHFVIGISCAFGPVQGSRFIYRSGLANPYEQTQRHCRQEPPENEKA